MVIVHVGKEKEKQVVVQRKREQPTVHVKELLRMIHS